MEILPTLVLALMAGAYLWRSDASVPEAPIAGDAVPDEDSALVRQEPTSEELEADVERYVAWMEEVSGKTILPATDAATALLDEEIDAMQSHLALLPEEIGEDTEALETLNEIMNDIDAMLRDDRGAGQQSAGDLPREALG